MNGNHDVGQMNFFRCASNFTNNPIHAPLFVFEESHKITLHFNKKSISETWALSRGNIWRRLPVLYNRPDLFIKRDLVASHSPLPPIYPWSLRVQISALSSLLLPNFWSYENKSKLFSRETALKVSKIPR